MCSSCQPSRGTIVDSPLEGPGGRNARGASAVSISHFDVDIQRTRVPSRRGVAHRRWRSRRQLPAPLGACRGRGRCTRAWRATGVDAR
jgi:hypothetical protein